MTCCEALLVRNATIWWTITEKQTFCSHVQETSICLPRAGFQGGVVGGSVSLSHQVEAPNSPRMYLFVPDRELVLGQVPIPYLSQPTSSSLSPCMCSMQWGSWAHLNAATPRLGSLGIPLVPTIYQFLLELFCHSQGSNMSQLFPEPGLQCVLWELVCALLSPLWCGDGGACWHHGILHSGICESHPVYLPMEAGRTSSGWFRMLIQGSFWFALEKRMIDRAGSLRNVCKNHCDHPTYLTYSYVPLTLPPGLEPRLSCVSLQVLCTDWMLCLRR